MKNSLQSRLVKYLEKNPGTRIAKAKIADLAREKMGVTGETVGRRLRVLVEVSQWPHALSDTPEHTRARELLGDAKLERELVGGHCHYIYQPSAQQTVRRVVIENGVAREIVETVSNT